MKKYVLTGGQCAGKTSLILALEFHGEHVVREAGSDYLYYERAKGHAFPSDSENFEEEILKFHLQREARIPPSIKRAFLDRGKPDHLVYSNLFRWPLSDELKQAALEVDYAGVFLVRHFGEEWIEKVNMREREDSMRIESALIEIYEQLGCNLICVPPGKLEDRVSFILTTLNDDIIAPSA
jgi:predicted ATPase